MIKKSFIFITILLLFKTANAQKRDPAVYFIKSPGTLVSSADSADYFLLILPPDTSVDKSLFPVKEYYKNGKIRMVGTSKSKTALKLQGPQVHFFQNGRRSLMATYDDGERVGDELAYYPKGKLYNIKKYTADHKVLYNELRDSTGQVLVENGNGRWAQFDDDFKAVEAEGSVADGLPEGEWHVITKGMNYTQIYKKGKLVSSQSIPANAEKTPEFPGGIEKFYNFIQRNKRYPDAARRNQTEGKVIVQFVVETDGSLTDIKVIRGIGDGCDEEAVRIIKLSPRWVPGVQNGKTVRVQYNVPISFSLSD